MLCNNKYYILLQNKIAVQISKEEHERIRLLRKEDIFEISVDDPIWKNCIRIDDPSMNE